MAAPEKIQVQLSHFEKLQILRDQLEERKKELAKLETDIRDQLALLETQRYLEGLSPYYAASPVSGLPSRDAIEAAEARRAMLYDLVANIEATIPGLLSGKSDAPARAGQAASAPAGPARKVKFDSFDDFRKNQA